MQYLYHPDASSTSIILTGDAHRYLFKVRRHRAGEQIHLRNLEDTILYTYEITAMDKKEAILHLLSQQHLSVASSRALHIGWCIIDPKSIEKVLPSLNEIGVEQITFIYCERSQKQFKLDFERLRKILLNSSQQCGRSVMMNLTQAESLDAFLEAHPAAKLLHFSQKKLSATQSVETIVIGCEGGLSEGEVARFRTEDIIGLDTPLILRSESAAAGVASKLLL